MLRQQIFTNPIFNQSSLYCRQERLAQLESCVFEAGGERGTRSIRFLSKVINMSRRLGSNTLSICI